jgi:7-carboxy-7-deazaguanine synthase
VEITGGEPLIQEDTPSLIYALLQTGYDVLLETNGSLDVTHIDKRCVKIVDIKCPSSGEHDKIDLGILKRLTDKDEIKFVIGSRDDYEYARQMLARMRKPPLAKKNRVHFSPVFEKMEPKTLSAWILEDHLDVGLNLQLHKIIWGHEKRGV